MALQMKGKVNFIIKFLSVFKLNAEVWNIKKMSEL